MCGNERGDDGFCNCGCILNWAVVMESERQSNRSGQVVGKETAGAFSAKLGTNLGAKSGAESGAESGATLGASPRVKPGLDNRGLPVGYGLKGDWEVTPRQTAALMMGEGKPLLLDCRLLEEWEVCRIDGAKLFPMQGIEQQAEDVEDAAGGKDKPIVVYCHHGRRSLQVTATLRGLGFTNVKSMAGGIDLWSMDIDGAVKRY